MTNSTFTKTLLALAALLLIAGGIAIGTQWERAAADPFQNLPACAEEDSSNCYWDADARGNGKGQSFIDIEGVTYPVSR